MNIFGLVSGMDTGSLIDAVMQAQRIPILQIQARQSGVESQISKLGEITSKVNDLKTFLEDLQERQDIIALTGTSGDEDILGVTADSDASPGAYDIEITQLAAAEKDRSAAFASRLAEVKAGTLSIAVNGGAAVDVAIAEGDTLQDVVDAINAADAGVDASLIFDGTSTYMQLVAQESGHTIAGDPSDAITLTESYTGATGTELGLAEITQAANALFTVDGLAVEQQSNTVTEVIAGVTLDLVATGSTTGAVAKDKVGTKENVEAFVDALNDVIKLVRDNLKVTEYTNRQSSLAGDPTIRSLRSELIEVITTEIEGLDGPFGALSQIGITQDATGNLKIDDDELEAAIDQDINALSDLFVHADTGLVDSFLERIEDYVDETDGFLTMREEALESQVDRYDERMDRLETRLEGVQTRLERQFSAMEQIMQQLQTQGSAMISMLGG